MLKWLKNLDRKAPQLKPVKHTYLCCFTLTLKKWTFCTREPKVKVHVAAACRNAACWRPSASVHLHHFSSCRETDGTGAQRINFNVNMMVTFYSICSQLELYRPYFIVHLSTCHHVVVLRWGWAVDAALR